MIFDSLVNVDFKVCTQAVGKDEVHIGASYGEPSVLAC